jgi:hypothetical protein
MPKASIKNLCERSVKKGFLDFSNFHYLQSSTGGFIGFMCSSSSTKNRQPQGNVSLGRGNLLVTGPQAKAGEDPENTIYPWNNQGKVPQNLTLPKVGPSGAQLLHE